MKKGDPRVRYTRMILQNSLIDLMKKRPISKIGIKEVCALAGVSRSTFYTHFKDVYDLLDQIAEEAFLRAEEIMHTYGIARITRRQILDTTQSVFQFIAENSGLLQVLLSENGAPGFQRRFFQKFVEMLEKALRAGTRTPADKATYECYSVFIVHGGIGLVRHWLENGMRTPIPELAKMMITLTQEIWR
jgi:AcrR family transcriptional regulator